LLPARARPARGALAPRMAQLLAAKRGASAASTSANTGTSPAAPTTTAARLVARRTVAASFPLRVPGTRSRVGRGEGAPPRPEGTRYPAGEGIPGAGRTPRPPRPVVATSRPSPAAPAAPAKDK